MGIADLFHVKRVRYHSLPPPLNPTNRSPGNTASSRPSCAGCSSNSGWPRTPACPRQRGSAGSRASTRWARCAATSPRWAGGRRRGCAPPADRARVGGRVPSIRSGVGLACIRRLRLDRKISCRGGVASWRRPTPGYDVSCLQGVFGLYYRSRPPVGLGVPRFLCLFTAIAPRRSCISCRSTHQIIFVVTRLGHHVSPRPCLRILRTTHPPL